MRKFWPCFAKLHGYSDEMVVELGRWAGAEIRHLPVSKQMIEHWEKLGQHRAVVPAGYAEVGAVTRLVAMLRLLMRKLGQRAEELGDVMVFGGREAWAQFLPEELREQGVPERMQGMF